MHCDFVKYSICLKMIFVFAFFRYTPFDMHLGSKNEHGKSHYGNCEKNPKVTL
jgi:hypothetical protein